MNESTQMNMSLPPRHTRRFLLWHLLLGSVLWGTVSFGCVTLNYVTDVYHTADDYAAVVSLDVEIDKGVYAALLELEPSMGQLIVENQKEGGWSVDDREAARLMLIRRLVDPLDELAKVPQLLAGEDGDLSDSFVQSTAVTTRDVDEKTVEYVYTATVIMDATSTDSSSGDGGSEWSLSMDEALSEYPDLLAAVDAAGPAKLIVQAYLPGAIVEQSVNGLDSGPDSGEVIGGRVRWIFTDEKPGTYVLRAVSRGPSRTLMEGAIMDILSQRPNIKQFLDLFGGDDMMLTLFAWGAAETLVEVRAALGKDLDATTYSPTEQVILEAAFLAQFCDMSEAKTSCLMPSVHRALPIVQRLAIQNGDDEVGGLVIEQVVDQLVVHDLTQWAAGDGSGE